MHNDNLWAPWRWSYIQRLGPDQSVETPKNRDTSDQPLKECFLCEAAKSDVQTEEAQQRLVLIRDNRGVVLLNRFPYTNGHLLVAPLDHQAMLTDLSLSQRSGLIELTAIGQQLLQNTINPQGFNVGINLGRCAGAGLPGHLHVHIVPRWHGDTNFMQVVGDIRVIPQALEDSYHRLRTVLHKTAATLDQSDITPAR